MRLSASDLRNDFRGGGVHFIASAPGRRNPSNATDAPVLLYGYSTSAHKLYLIRLVIWDVQCEYSLATQIQ